MWKIAVTGPVYAGEQSLRPAPASETAAPVPLEPKTPRCASTSMPEGAYQDGYRAGWEGVAGAAPLPPNPTRPTEAGLDDYALGFKYGRADALERFKPRR